MNTVSSKGVLMGCLLLLSAGLVGAQDWPQWRGPNRDNKVTGLTVPKEWPKALTEKWKVTVGGGDAGPVVVGDKVYTFAREGGDEVISCIDAASGKIVWQNKYATQGAARPAGGIHEGPRCTPVVAQGKICTLGVRGVVSCVDTSTGKVAWRKDTKDWPRFYTSSSPLIVDGKCIAYVGGTGGGEVTAYDLASGDVKWKCPGPEPAYGSPVLATFGGTKQIVTPTKSSVMGIDVADGKRLWEFSFKAKYNNNTPVVYGDTVLYSSVGAGSVAYKIEKKDGAFKATQVWKKDQATSQYNTPVLKDGLLFGIAGAGRGSGTFFCMSAKTGDVLWNNKTRRGDCGEIFNAGPVLVALTNDTQLIVFKPSDKEYVELAKYKVADSPTWAPPALSGNRIFVKDQTTLRLLTIE